MIFVASAMPSSGLAGPGQAHGPAQRGQQLLLPGPGVVQAGRQDTVELGQGFGIHGVGHHGVAFQHGAFHFRVGPGCFTQHDCST